MTFVRVRDQSLSNRNQGNNCNARCSSNADCFLFFVSFDMESIDWCFKFIFLTIRILSALFSSSRCISHRVAFRIRVRFTVMIFTGFVHFCTRDFYSSIHGTSFSRVRRTDHWFTLHSLINGCFVFTWGHPLTCISVLNEYIQVLSIERCIFHSH